MARLFIALRPPPDTLRALESLGAVLGAGCGGNPVPAPKIHLTLAFLGELDGERSARAAQVAGKLRSRPFEVALNRVGSFRSARVAWVGVAQPPAALLTLQAKLAGALQAAGFELDARPFVAHLTLVRHIARSVPEASIEPISWQVRELALVQSHTGTGRYSEVAAWPLSEA